MLYWLYHTYLHAVPQHRGKGRMIGLLGRAIAWRHRLFTWRMRDGSRVAIRPDEAVRTYGVGAVCFHERSWEPHVQAMIERLLRPGDVALDIGANIGVFTVAMGSAVGPAGRIHAFEPAGQTFDQLRRTVAANGLAQVECHQLAVADTPGVLDLFVPEDVSANASAFERRHSGGVARERVQVVTVDEFVRSRGVGSVRLMKVDVEGSELSALKGASELIARDRPHIIVEWNPETAALAGWSASDLAAFARSVGDYRIHLILREGKTAVVPIEQVTLGEGAYLDLYLEPA